jgi:hypothetical protein
VPVLLYGCETWSQTLKEEHGLRVFENRVLRIIFRPRRVEVTGGWRKLHNEELHDLYSSSSIITVIKSRMRWVGHVARMEKKSTAYRLLVETPERRRPLGRPRRRWANIIEIDVAKKGLGGVCSIGVSHDMFKFRALVNSVINLRVP